MTDYYKLKQGAKYGDREWMSSIVTPCSEDPELWDAIGEGEQMNVRHNERIVEAKRRCREGTNKNPGPCPRIAECLNMGQRVRDFAPGVYGATYLSRTRHVWPR